VRDRGERGFETMTTRTIIRSISDLLDTAGYARTDPAGVLHLDTAVELLPDGTVSLGNPSYDGSVTIAADDTVSVWVAGDVAASAVVPGAYDWYASTGVTAEEVAADMNTGGFGGGFRVWGRVRDGYVGGAWYSDGSYPRLADNERRIPCPRRRLTAQDVERYWDEAED
jgi:hypothetical protein